MSVQFGKCNFDGEPVDPKDLDQVRPLLTPYGPDGEGYLCKESLGILYRAFHLTKESRNEVQPYVSASKVVITWDGRLDNRKELVGQLGREFPANSTDVAIVAVAYEQWGTDCFAKLIGDWALSICDYRDRSLILAKDFVGTRHLYYTVENDRMAWCTILDPLVLFARHCFALEEEYVAGWLSYLPAAHLTPYVGIHSVPPSSFARFARGMQKITKYWDFDPGKQIRYRKDSEYEEHFRAAFAVSVRRRLRSDSPVLAELSGGVDSSSIVCMADNLISGGQIDTPRLDTISYFDNSEPNWDEHPYFTRIEEKRGRTGSHIDIASEHRIAKPYEEDRFAATPGSTSQSLTTVDQFAAILRSQANRAVLSGIGGDETLGGVPTPIPELANLLARTELLELGKQLVAWALARRKPVLHLLAETLAAFVPGKFALGSSPESSIFWLESEFVTRHRAALRGYTRQLRLFDSLPSFQQNVSTLDALRRQLASFPLTNASIYDVRYPYLDRELLEFIYAIPREQIVRPLQRRSLMRRALVGIVPDEILNRKRKAFVVRGPMMAMLAERPKLIELSEEMLTASLGIVSSKKFARTLQQAHLGKYVTFMMRTVEVECWLRHIACWDLWKPCRPSNVGNTKYRARTRLAQSSAS